MREQMLCQDLDSNIAQGSGVNCVQTEALASFPGAESNVSEVIRDHEARHQIHQEQPEENDYARPDVHTSHKSQQTEHSAVSALCLGYWQIWRDW